jgi:hypothetical protein
MQRYIISGLFGLSGSAALINVQVETIRNDFRLCSVKFSGQRRFHRVQYDLSVKENIFFGGPYVTRSRTRVKGCGSIGTILPIVFAEKSGDT